MNKLRFKIAALACLLFSCILSAKEADLTQRLSELSASLEQARQEQNIPGMAIAIVKDDKVIFTKGFGYADLENKRPVTPETIFATGSTGKAFTATLIGMLVDEQKMQWDAPLQTYLPDVHFDVGENEQLTIRDMLSHRTGYSRNDILWANGKVDQEIILKTATKAEPFSTFRKSFDYNNVMFMAAGMASAKQAEQSWDDLLATRIFAPLGMNEATSSIEKAKSHPHMAKGYTWKEVEKVHERLPMRSLDRIAPAGGINANVLDMANWLRMQLNQGKFEGKRLISEEQLNETHSPQIKIADGMAYGMGWFLRSWEGKKVVEHGGNIDGFGAQVAMLPKENIGFVLLTNLTASPLQQMSVNMVWDHLVAEQKAEEATTQGGYGAYVGEYIGNFGPFKDAIFTVQMKNNSLAVDVPGQTLYELKSPDEHGKMYFKLTDTVAVSFESKPSGEVSAMRMHQSGMDFELPRKGVPIKPEIDPAELAPYLGQYYSKGLKANSTALIQNHRLAIDVPGQMVYELHLPDEEGKWRFRINQQLAVTFDRDDNGEITHLIFYRGGQLNDKMARVAEKGDDQTPSVKLADVIALRATTISENAPSEAVIRLTGKIHLKQAGISGDLSQTTLGNDHYRLDVDLGPFGNVKTAVSPEQGAVKDSFSPFVSLTGKYLRQAQQFYPMPDLDWSSRFETIRFVKQEEINGTPVYVVRLKNPDLPNIINYIDTKTGLVIKQQGQMLFPGIGAMPISYKFEDYREVAGRMLPFKITSKDQQRGVVEVVLKEAKTDLKLEKDYFHLSED